MKHTVVALVEDRPGVLNRVASLFRRRGFNIDSLAVGTTEEQGISRMTIVVKVSDLTKEEAVLRELALIKVKCTREQRRDVLDLLEIFRARAVDVSPSSMIVQAVSDEEGINALIDNLRPFGIQELTRTGRVAMVRGAKTTAVNEREPEEIERFHAESGRLPEGDLPYVSK